MCDILEQVMEEYDVEDILDAIDIEDIEEYVENCTVDTSPDAEIRTLKRIYEQHRSRAYMTKEDLKAVLCEIVDDWYIGS